MGQFSVEILTAPGSLLSGNLHSGLGKARIALARVLSVILYSIWRSCEPLRLGPETAA